VRHSGRPGLDADERARRAGPVAAERPPTGRDDRLDEFGTVPHDVDGVLQQVAWAAADRGKCGGDVAERLPGFGRVIAFTDEPTLDIQGDLSRDRDDGSRASDREMVVEVADGRGQRGRVEILDHGGALS
jgi:hypothetical protein